MRMLRSVFHAAIAGAIALALPAAAAENAPKKAVEPKRAVKKAVEPRAAKKKRVKVEKLACRLGTEDEHARIAVLLADGKVDSFAYYSKWKPRTCSMEVKRDDAFSKWEDTGNTTVVTLVEEKGAFLIDHSPGRYHFIFRDIDRMRYCGMEGKVNGTLTIWTGRPQCQVTGVMDREPEPVAAVGKPEVAYPQTGDGEDVAAKPAVSAYEIKVPSLEPRFSPGEKPAPAPVPAAKEAAESK